MVIVAASMQKLSKCAMRTFSGTRIFVCLSAHIIVTVCSRSLIYWGTALVSFTPYGRCRHIDTSTRQEFDMWGHYIYVLICLDFFSSLTFGLSQSYTNAKEYKDNQIKKNYFFPMSTKETNKWNACCLCEVCRDVAIKPFFNVIQCDFIFDPSKATRFFDLSVDRSYLLRQIPRIVNCVLATQNLDQFTYITLEPNRLGFSEWDKLVMRSTFS